MKLNYQTYFDQLNENSDLYNLDIAPILIIPGLFGSLGNWRGFAKKLSEFYPVIVVDQRNHGDSPHSSDNSLFDMVNDLIELLDDLGISKVSLCGHSMGGKTAMVFALMHPDRLDQLIVLDIAPVTYSHSHAPILEGLLQVDLAQAESRSDVEKQLVEAIPDKNTRLFLMLSLAGKPKNYFWKLNALSLYENLSDISGFPISQLEDRQYAKDCLFLKGGDSEYVTEEHFSRIYSLFPDAQIISVEGAAHWVHIDKPNEVLHELLQFLKKEKKYD